MGAVHAGQGFLSLGTSGVLFVVSPRFAPNAASATHAFCHALPQRWHQMSVMLSAASCLQWARQALGAASESELEAKASRLSLSERAAAPLFLPYLGGERTPHNDAQVRGGFHGISHSADQAALAYAVMEGVGFGLTDGMNALQQAGCSIQRLSLVGGGARSARWAQQLASSLQVEIATHAESAAGGALGAARLGWLARLGGGAASVETGLPPASNGPQLPARRRRAGHAGTALCTIQGAVPGAQERGVNKLPIYIEEGHTEAIEMPMQAPIRSNRNRTATATAIATAIPNPTPNPTPTSRRRPHEHLLSRHSPHCL